MNSKIPKSGAWVSNPQTRTCGTQPSPRRAACFRSTSPSGSAQPSGSASAGAGPPGPPRQAPLESTLTHADWHPSGHLPGSHRCCQQRPGALVFGVPEISLASPRSPTEDQARTLGADEPPPPGWSSRPKPPAGRSRSAALGCMARPRRPAVRAARGGGDDGRPGTDAARPRHVAAGLRARLRRSWSEDAAWSHCWLAPAVASHPLGACRWYGLRSTTAARTFSSSRPFRSP
jgi:hypothetical protein